MSETANPQITEMLRQQLRDIQLPEPVSWWPLAPGWWVLICIALIALVAIVVYLRRRWQEQQYRKLLLREHDELYTQWQAHGETTRYCQDVNRLLKRCILNLTPSATNTEALSKSGTLWLNALEALYKPLSDDTRMALAEGAYQPEQRLAQLVDVAAMHKEVENWLQHHQRGDRS